MNLPIVVAEPPGVTTSILADRVPTGTVTVICVSETTANVVAGVEPETDRARARERRAVRPSRAVPTGPDVGEKLAILGSMRPTQGSSGAPGRVRLMPPGVSAPVPAG